MVDLTLIFSFVLFITLGLTESGRVGFIFAPSVGAAIYLSSVSNPNNANG